MSAYAKTPGRFLAGALVVVFGVIVGLTPSRAATPEAWVAHEKEVVTACAAASNLHDPTPGGAVVDFDDRVGFTAVIIEGYYPQPRMKHKRGRVLCLFEKRTRIAFVSAADSIVRKRQP